MLKNTNSPDSCKQAIGIDVAKATLEVRFGSRTPTGALRYSRCRSVANSPEGFATLWEWVGEHCGEQASPWFVMEATGVYYEQLAWFLHQRQAKVCVLVPSRAAHYAKSLPIKSKTDAIDAQILARYGLERRPRRWQPASERLCRIKALLRERHQLKCQRTQLKNRLHAARQAYQYPPSSIRRLVDHIGRIEQYLDDIQHELDQLWQSEQTLAEPIRRIASISGIGSQTVLEVVAETNGFALIENRNQLASYGGLDVVLDESGSRQGATKISKQGNAHIRRALYMPAVCASQHNRALRAFYQRLVRRNPGKKKVALVAVMRKLLLLIYSLWNSGQEYDPEFHYRQITNAA